MKILDLRDCELSLRGYGGAAGRKVGIVIDGEPWIAKFPRTTRDLVGRHLPSYTSSPVSEYLGSHIYELLGVPAHRTELGFMEGKVVCACKDFTWPDKLLIDFKSIKNATPDELEGYERVPSDGDCIFLSDVLSAIEVSPILSRVDGVEERFWDQFVVDAFIKNPDRNNGNWGVLLDRSGNVELAPVYDNGSSLFSKRSPEFAEERLADESLIRQDAITDVTSCYRIADPEVPRGHAIHPFRYMMTTENPDLMAAIVRFVDRCDLAAIDQLIDSVPEEAYGTVVLSDAMRSSHKTLLRRRIEEGILPAYDRAVREVGPAEVENPGLEQAPVTSPQLPRHSAEHGGRAR